MASFTNPDNNIAQLELAGSERVAVFGSGAGGHSFAALHALHGNGRVTAIDVRQALLDRVLSDAETLRISGLLTKCADYQRLGGTGLQNGSLDVVIVPNTLFAVEDKDTMLQEAHRILKASGKLLIIDWLESFGGMGPQAENVVTAEMAKEIATPIGFTLIREFSAGAQHYGLIFTK